MNPQTCTRAGADNGNVQDVRDWANEHRSAAASVAPQLGVLLGATSLALLAALAL